MIMRSIAVSTLLGIVGFAAGCGGSGPSLVTVTGNVTLNSKPLEGAVVQFVPDPSNTAGILAEDQSGPTGAFKLMTKHRAGVVPGKYKVKVSKIILPPDAVIPEAFKDDPYMANLSLEGPETGKATKKKQDKIDGEFDVEIPPEGGVFDFDVKATAAAAAKNAGS